MTSTSLWNRKAALGVIALAGLFGGCGGDSTENSQPNVVFVLTDQWRAQATGYNGDPNLIGKTPNLDRIADSGINFRNAVSTTPVCTPFRAALLTGQYPTTTGMIFNDLQLPAEAYTMAEMFGESGYKTAYIGKWHLDGMMRDAYTPPERRQGFDFGRESGSVRSSLSRGRLEVGRWGDLGRRILRCGPGD